MYKKVMVIDDSKIDLYVAKRLIEIYKYAEEAIIMDSAKEALDYLTANVDSLPERIFLDINMPEMNGFDFLDSYKKLPENVKKSCIIMMLTTSVHNEDKEKAYQNPYVRDYLNKPLSKDKLKTIK